jgi:chromate transporter
MKTYLNLTILFSGLSLMSIGGGNVVLPEMHLHAVQQDHWLTNAQFADIFAISQAAPGPSILIVTLVGYAAGLSMGGVLWGILGGIVATVAMIVPASILVYVVTKIWQKGEGSKIRLAIEKGFAPLTVGLITATCLVISRAADHDWKAYTLTAICTVIFLRTKINPLVVVAAAGLIGYLGFV